MTKAGRCWLSGFLEDGEDIASGIGEPSDVGAVARGIVRVGLAGVGVDERRGGGEAHEAEAVVVDARSVAVRREIREVERVAATLLTMSQPTGEEAPLMLQSSRAA